MLMPSRITRAGAARRSAAVPGAAPPSPPAPLAAARPRRASSSLSALTSVAATCIALPALASGPLGDNGAPITTSSYTIDLHQGSVFAGNRVMGLGGAYVAIAEDVDGDLQNPAAPAVRPFYSIEEFDYWLGLGLTFPARLSKIDFFNSGSETGFRGSSDEPVFVTPSLNIQWNNFGLGFTAELQNYAFQNRSTGAEGDPATPPSLAAVLSTFHLQGATSLLEGQLVLGAGVRLLNMALEAAPADLIARSLFVTSGSGLELGALFRPNLQPYRIGVAFRSAIDTQPSFNKNLLPNENGDIVVDGGGTPLYLPERVSLPWDINVGAAVQLGRRPLNPISRTIQVVAERARLQYRLRQIDRELERERLLAERRTTSETRAALAALEAEEARDEERLEAAYDAARQALSASFAEVGRFYVLVSGSLLVSGRVRDAVGVESFLDQRINRSGTSVVVSPRVGAESEIWENRLKARLGTYLEPTRFSTSRARQHLTLGADLRLFRWNVFGLWPDDFMWQLGGSVDVARRYLTWGISVAGWYPRHHRSEIP